MPTVFLNGRFLSRDEAVVSAFDAGFQHGVGLFETMMAVVGVGQSDTAIKRMSENECVEDGASGWEIDALRRVRVVHLRAHVQRLADSARVLGLSESIRVGALEEAVTRTVARASMELPDQQRFRVRLTITGGDLNLLGKGHTGITQRMHEGSGHQPTVLIVAQPATEYPREMFERGVGVTVADLRPNPLDAFAGHKTLSYWPRLRELQLAATKGAGEALVFQVSNHLAGGCVSNVLLAKKGVILTPWARGEVEGESGGGEVPGGVDEATGVPLRPGRPGTRGARLPSPVLPGVTRAWALEWALANMIEVEKKMLTIADVLDADEVLLTNSSWGVLPVVRVEKEAIGDAVVGEFARRLGEAWEGEVVSSPGS
jgi:branched-subunit amino acid aminotransferase/4-amino-4-deoxychorismate lyase